MRLELFPARPRRSGARSRYDILFFLGLIGLMSADPGHAEPPVPHTIVVFGDSQAQGVAGALQRMALRDRSLHIIDKTVPGTGLSQKKQFDWVATIEQFLATEHPDAAVLMLGGNDRLPVRLEEGGHAIAFKSDAWKAMYVERMDAILKDLAQTHIPVVWLGQPIAREPTYSGDMAYLNSIYAETVPDGGGIWMPLWDVVTDETGAYAPYGKGVDGETKRLRLDDGIHFTPAGYDIVGQKLRARIDALLATTTPTATAPTNVAGHS
jgi:hypothetical protein